MFLSQNLYHAQEAYSFISELVGEDNVLMFVADELLRSEELTSSNEFLLQRLYALSNIVNNNSPKIIITHPHAFLRYLPTKEEFLSLLIKIEKNKTYKIEDIRGKLIQAGYKRVNKIDQPLQFASRGDILDIYSVNYENPIRIEFFDEEIESIRPFNLSTQISFKEELDFVDIYPATDIPFTEQEITDFNIDIFKEIEKDKEYYGSNFSLLKERLQEDIESIRLRERYSRVYKYFSRIKNQTNSLLDYLDKDSITLVSNKEVVETNINNLYNEYNKFNLEMVNNAIIPARTQSFQDIERIYLKHKNFVFSTQIDNNYEYRFIVRPIVYTGQSVSDYEHVLKSYITHNEKIIVALSNFNQLKTVEEFLNKNGYDYELIDNLSIQKKKIGLLVKDIEEGFEIPSINLSVLTSRELFGQTYKKNRLSSKFKEAKIINAVDELNVGDYVVHEYRGIGQYLGLETKEIDGIHRDFLHIQYAGTDELYVPLSQFKLVRKFAAREGVKPKLNSLSGTQWNKTKTKIRQRLQEIAQKLVNLYSERMKVEGFAFSKDDELQEMFEKAFPFELTPDQEIALQEIKQDMEKPIPMDRLLCGDVGFGKTEVAFRAAFKAIFDHKQVAMLCPTTLLARQHYEVALERFKDFGVRIAVFSRLVSKKEQAQNIEKIKAGKIDLIIGTHRLLSKDIEYNDLGLLIVDEEQRFGVEQKEKIKEIKTNVDVLSLSATPIPRTLQMSLIGLRGYSQIITPPNARIPIQTFVMKYDYDVVVELIERELSRKGQTFYLHNNVNDLYIIANKLQKSIKYANIGVVHGQMDKDDIEDVMIKFYSGEINLLICTSIVENGIDVPNANLMIVDDADMFGLSQLYQIKGRVGRGDRIAYAYFMFRPNRIIGNENARKRLKTIEEFTEFGSGYKIAQRDLLIRGAGDILGPEQAGYIDQIGIELYMKLLDQAIKGESIDIEDVTPNKMLTLNAYIPKKYAVDEDKIEIYQKIEECKNSGELADLSSEIRDIYGNMPEEVEALLHKKQIDIYLDNPIFKQLNDHPNNIEVVLNEEFTNINGIGVDLFKVLYPIMNDVKVHYDQKVLKIYFMKNGNWSKTLEKSLNDIINLYNRKIND